MRRLVLAAVVVTAACVLATACASARIATGPGPDGTVWIEHQRSFLWIFSSTTLYRCVPTDTVAAGNDVHPHCVQPKLHDLHQGLLKEHVPLAGPRAPTHAPPTPPKPRPQPPPVPEGEEPTEEAEPRRPVFTPDS